MSAGKEAPPGQRDIRKFFGGAPKPAAASQPAKDDDEVVVLGSTEPGAAALPASAKSPKPTPAKKTPPAKKAPASAKKATPSSAKKATPPSSAKKAAPARPASAAKGAAAKRKKSVVDVDSDFEVDLSEEGSSSSDEEMEAEVEEEADEDGVVVISSDDDGDAAPAKKKAAAAPAPKRQKTAAAPAPAKRPAAARPKAPTGPLALIAGDAAAMAAVAAVDAAAAALPPEADLGITFVPETAYNARAPDEPPRRGAKPAPRGHPDCLTGKTLVCTGVLDSLARPEFEDFVRRHGGKVTTAVSSRTSFLVAGAFSGRSKYAAAKEKGVRIINEDGLFALVAATQAPAEQQQQQQQQQASPPAAAAAAQPAAAAVAPAAAVPHPAAAAAGAGAPARPAAAAPPPPRAGGDAGSQLWVEKWRPKTSAELVGNPQVVSTLRLWLQTWDAVHLRGAPPPAPPGAAGRRADAGAAMRKKAVMLSGSPGLGKTSAALIVARECGYEPIEINASDTRSKADASVLKGVGGKLANAVKELSTNRGLVRGGPAPGGAGGARAARRLCLIMDECDGMSAGDRGGVADLIATLKASKVPVICICNDKYSQKLKSLRNHCLELDFRKPTAQQIAKRLQTIAAAEGLAMNAAAMEALVNASGTGDIRLILGQLQMLRLRQRAVSYDDVRRAAGGAAAKDVDMSPFEAARRLLDAEGAGLSLGDQLDLVFQDLDLVPLLVQENYLNHRPRIAPDERARMAVAAKAADAFSAGDLAARAVRAGQNWALAPFAAAMGAAFPAAYARGAREPFGLWPGEPNFPRFTAWLGANSSGRKQARLLGELHTRLLASGAFHADRTALRLAVLPVLRRALTAPLVRRGKEGIPEVVGLMQGYCMAREDLDFVLDVTRFKTGAPWGADPYKEVETATKSAFTRAFNAAAPRSKTGFGMEDAKKKRGAKGGRAAAADDDDDEGDGDGALGGEGGDDAGAAGSKQDEDEEEPDPAQVLQAVKGLKSKGMTLTLKDGSTAARPARGRGSRGGKAAAGAGAGRGRGRGAKK